jgi:hypothetical protein
MASTSQRAVAMTVSQVAATPEPYPGHLLDVDARRAAARARTTGRTYGCTGPSASGLVLDRYLDAEVNPSWPDRTSAPAPASPLAPPAVASHAARARHGFAPGCSGRTAYRYTALSAPPVLGGGRPDGEQEPYPLSW